MGKAKGYLLIGIGIVIGIILVAIIGFAMKLKPIRISFGNASSGIPTTASLVELQPTPSPDLANLYTFFPPPSIGSTRTYNYSYIYAQYDQNMNITGHKTETGSYTETIRIVNQDYSDENVTIMGVEIQGTAYMAPCGDFYWAVYNSQRLYFICKQDYVFNAAGEIASDPSLYLTAHSQYSNDSLEFKPDYFAPFDIGKYWDSSKYDDNDISVANKITKTTSFGTYENCFQFRLFAPNFNELRYLCPKAGLIAVEVYDHDDYYSAELVSAK